MGADPWNRSEGRYDTPSSAVPVGRRAVRADAPVPRRRDVDPAVYADEAPITRPAQRFSAIESRIMAAEQDGVVAIGADTILARIDEAIAAIVTKGHGRATAIYLTDSDLIALRDALGSPPEEYRDLRVAHGATSKVYSKRGSTPVRRPKGVNAGAAVPLALFERPG
ncbi:MAG: hypothetical protein FJ335_01415 [Sphingomonadales bacterium]|nr:hypothetical protein [Sphingomonadales bacterium]